MSSENKSNAPRRGPGHGPNFEKPKNFKIAISKLLFNLKTFKIFILISLMLAMVSAILSLVSPNRLADLTDEVQKGIVLNTNNLQIILDDTKANLSDNTIIDNVTISYQDKLKFCKNI